MESSSSNNSANSSNQNSANTTNKPNASTPSNAPSSEGLMNNIITDADDREICLEIAPTTGGTFDFNVHCHESIDNLKKNIAKKLKVSKEQICLLHRDRLLQSGVVRDYGLADGSRISLVTSVETGLLTQRPEQSVLEALEGLNESQVGDFLSGKSPLNLTMRLGDHVMLIQLQLSKGTSAENSSSSSSSGGCGSSSNLPPTINTTPVQTSQAPESPRQQPSSPQSETTRNTNATPSNSGSLAEASRNLTNTLKKLSNHVTRDESITNHMQHHGKGVYSGTFSGTLNPALQDGLGKPRKHVSTIVHILNDLLGGMEPKGGKRGTATEGSSSSGQNSTGPQTKKPKLMTRLEKERENEELRAKMEKIKESLRMRKEKLINK